MYGKKRLSKELIGKQGPQWLDGPAMQELEKKILGRGNFPSKDLRWNTLASHSSNVHIYEHVLLIKAYSAI